MPLGDSPVQLDEIDVQLLQALQVDCKTSLAKLGQQVGLSAPSVMERVRKLEQSGVIKGYHAVVDARRLGHDITAFIGISINFPKNSDAFIEAVEDIPAVLECHHVTGAHTFMLKARTRNTASLEDLIGRLRVLEGVTRTETMVVLSTRTERSRVELQATGESGPKRTRRSAKKPAPTAR